MKPEAISSQVGEVTKFAEFPWSFLTSILSEFVHYRHLVLSVRVFTFVTITQFGFMLHGFMHSKSIFLCGWHTNIVSTRSLANIFSGLSEYPFWYIHTFISHMSSVFSFISVSSVWFLCILFRTFIFTLITLELLIFFFLLMDF